MASSTPVHAPSCSQARLPHAQLCHAALCCAEPHAPSPPAQGWVYSILYVLFENAMGTVKLWAVVTGAQGARLQRCTCHGPAPPMQSSRHAHNCMLHRPRLAKPHIDPCCRTLLCRPPQACWTCSARRSGW